MLPLCMKQTHFFIVYVSLAFVCLCASAFRCACLSVCVCARVIKKGERMADAQRGLLFQTPQQQSVRVSAEFPVWIFIGYAVITTATQTGSGAALHDRQMDRKIKNTSRECADTLPNLFLALKIHTQTHEHRNIKDALLPGLCHCIFTLAVLCFEYLSFPFRNQTASSLFRDYMRYDNITIVFKMQHLYSSPRLLKFF